MKPLTPESLIDWMYNFKVRPFRGLARYLRARNLRQKIKQRVVSIAPTQRRNDVKY